MQKLGFNLWRKVRTVAIWSIVTFLIGGCVCEFAVVVGTLRAWDREVAPFVALGAREVATGGDDFGRLAGREGVGAIYFNDNVGDAELAALTKRLQRFPNLHALKLEGPKVTDAGLVNLKGLKQLNTLILFNTRVTEEGKVDLRRAASKTEDVTRELEVNLSNPANVEPGAFTG